VWSGQFSLGLRADAALTDHAASTNPLPPSTLSAFGGRQAIFFINLPLGAAGW
jgi:hypothetical protein